MVPTVRQILTQMHRQIQTDMGPLKRTLRLHFNFAFVKDLLEGSCLQFVDNQTSITNTITGESLHAYMAYISP
jgi:hypothetical protein